MAEESPEHDLTGLYVMTGRDEDALTYDCVPAVDLSLAYSPVVPHSWSERPLKRVLPTVGGKYLLHYGRVELLHGQLSAAQAAEVVEEETLRVMRARYLVRRGYYSLYIEMVYPYYARDAVLRDYFGGSLWQMPAELLRKARKSWRLHLHDVLSAVPPGAHVVEGRITQVLRVLKEKERDGEKECS